MKKKSLKVKLNLNKEVISNLNDIKGGDSTLTKFVASKCICAETMQVECDTKSCYTMGDECCSAGTSKIICC